MHNIVGTTGFEPATFCSQSRRATNCATFRNKGETGLEGLEPPTCCLEGSCSILMSYKPKEFLKTAETQNENFRIKGFRRNGKSIAKINGNVKLYFYILNLPTSETRFSILSVFSFATALTSLTALSICSEADTISPIRLSMDCVTSPSLRISCATSSLP